MAHLDRWLAARDLGGSALTPAIVDTYFADRRAAGYGERIYSWAWVATDPETAADEMPSGTGQHQLLIRRNDATGELAYHRCYTPSNQIHDPRPGRRTTLADRGNFQAAKGLTGHDDQVRRWRSWHRWTTLAM